MCIRDRFSAAIPLIIAIADFSWTIGDVSFGGIAIGAVCALLIYHTIHLIGGWRGTAGARGA